MNDNDMHVIKDVTINDISVTIDTIGPILSEKSSSSLSPWRIIYVIVGTIFIFIIGTIFFSKINQYHDNIKSVTWFLIQLAIDTINVIINILRQLYDDIVNNTTTTTTSDNDDLIHRIRKDTNNRWEELNDDDDIECEQRSVKFTISYDDNDDNDNNDNNNDNDDDNNKSNINPIITIGFKNMSINNNDNEETNNDDSNSH